MDKYGAIVAGIYEAFGKGDVPFILDNLADDVRWEDWENNSAQQAGLPSMAARMGKQDVIGFFQVAAGMGIKDFRVLNLMEGENQVAVEVFIETNSYRDEEIHLWTFNMAGKVVRLRHYVDTAKHIEAAKNVMAAAQAG